MRGQRKGETGSGDVNSRFMVNIEEGLEAAGFTVTSKAWLDAQDAAAGAEKNAHLAELRERAEREHLSPVVLSLNEHFTPTAIAPLTEAQIAVSDTDTAIYVLAQNSGEGTDRFNIPGDYQLLPAEESLLTLLGQHYSKVIVLLNVGGVVNAAAIRDIPGISAILLVSQCGNLGGHVAADVLLGRTIPSGRLTDTWAVRYEDSPSSAEFSHNNGNWDDEYYRDGIYVGYRYFDTFNITPLYPFGYGLNYTTFSLETLDVQADETAVSVTVQVTNMRDTYAGREVVQVYASAPEGTLEKPY